MDIVKKRINNYDVFVHNTKKYATIGFALFYEMPYTKKNIYVCDLLGEYMVHSCKKYSTRKLFKDKMLDMYSMNVSINNYNVGEKLFVQVTFDFYDPALVGDDYLKEALNTARDVLELNESDGTLNSEELNRDKDDIISAIGHELMSNRSRENNSYKKFVYPNTYFTEDLIENKKEIEDIIDKITDTDLINMYNKIFSESFVGAFLIGNIKEEYLEWIGEIFKFEKVLELDKNYNREILVDKKNNYLKVEDKDYKESILRVAYYCPSESFKEKMVYNVISKMLGSIGMILHKILRDKYKLVYHTTCGYNKQTNILVLIAYIDGNKEKETTDAFLEVIELLKNDDELVEEMLLKVKENIELYIYTKDEHPAAVFSDMISEIFEYDVTDEVLKNTIDSIEVKDIKNALEKLEKIKTHFYKGVKE